LSRVFTFSLHDRIVLRDWQPLTTLSPRTWLFRC
jgi:hypothetical protein